MGYAEHIHWHACAKNPAELVIFLAPAYIAIRNDAGGVFSFTFLLGIHKAKLGLDVPLIFIASYYLTIVLYLYLFIVSASTTILLYRQIKRRGDIGEWIRRRYDVSLIAM